MSSTRPRRFRRAATAVLGGLAVIGTAQVLAPPTASAGQLGLVTEIQGAGRVTVVDGSLEDNGPTVCQFPSVVDQREVNDCARIRNWEVLAASVWLRPEAAPGWRFEHWSGCDETRTRDGAVECKVTSPDFNSVERRARAVFSDPVQPEVTAASQRWSTTQDRTVTYDFAVNKGQAQCSFDHQATWQACASGLTRTYPAAGSYAFAVRALDPSGRTSAPAVVDSHVLETEYLATPARVSNESNPAFTVRAPLATSVQCSLDGGPVVACGTPEVPFRLAVSDGPHELQVFGQGFLGRDHTPARYQWTVDTQAPDTVAGAATVTGRDVEIAFTGDADAVRYECRLDGGAWAACRPAVRYEGLAVGTHLVEVRAFDANGNADATPATVSFTVQGATQPGQPAPPARLQTTNAKVVRVVDADTLVVRAGSRTLTVDVAGLDARAPRCHAVRGTASLRTLARTGATVRITPTPASRLTGTSPWAVNAGSRDLGLLQLRAGHAKYDRREAPSTRRSAYAAAQQQARSARRGLWGRC